jgi:undecaprenol kinase/diacylglycerol kinase (ATP)
MKSPSLIKAFGYAGNGIIRFFRYDRNGRIHLLATVLICLAGWYWKISGMEWCAVLLCTALVTSLEMVNHALEKLCDMVHPEWHPVIKTVKDVSAGAVLVAAVVSMAVGLIIFIPKLSFVP